MNIDIPNQLFKIVEKFKTENFEVYIVGGAVRDILSDKEVYDWDLTTNATPDEILKLFDRAFYDNKFGTVGIPNDTSGERPYEVTTYRTEEGYGDNRRPDNVKWGTTLEEDISRRDFTINAMGLRIGQGKPNNNNLTTCDVELIDKYEGQTDLKDKLIRTVGNPSLRFSEDSLRMMRAVRIASEIGFTIEENTFEGIKSNSALINKISKERIKDELFKILKSKNPYEGIMMLKESGLMNEILPEIIDSFGVEQKSPGRHHVHDVGTHLFNSLKFVAERNPDPVVRLATLLHDIGKPKTYKKIENGTITFYNHEIVGSRIANKIADRLRLSNIEKERLFKLVRYHQFTVDENQTDSAVRRFITKVGIENVTDMLDLRVGDRLGGGARETSWRLEEFKKRLVEVQKQPFSIKDLKISGNDIMERLKLTPGPRVGEILQTLFDKVVVKELENERETLLAEVDKQESDS